MPRHDAVTLAWNAAFIGRDAPFSLPAFCAAADIPHRTASNWCAGIAPAPTRATAVAFRWMLVEDAGAALAFAARCLALEEVGVALVQLPVVRPRDGVTADAMHVARETGRVIGIVAECAADGAIDHVEAALIHDATRPLLQEVLELRADATAVPQPQLSLPERRA